MVLGVDAVRRAPRLGSRKLFGVDVHSWGGGEGEEGGSGAGMGAETRGRAAAPLFSAEAGGLWREPPAQTSRGPSPPPPPPPRSSPMMRAAPALTAASITASPTAPRPNTATEVPGWRGGCGRVGEHSRGREGLGGAGAGRCAGRARRGSLTARRAAGGARPPHLDLGGVEHGAPASGDAAAEEAHLFRGGWREGGDGGWEGRGDGSNNGRRSLALRPPAPGARARATEGPCSPGPAPPHLVQGRGLVDERHALLVDHGVLREGGGALGRGGGGKGGLGGGWDGGRVG
jgi:hypothetical protein